MRRTKLFTKTSKTVAKDADSVNAKLLLQGGFINMEMAGVYTYLPLGLRVLNNIENIVREEMNLIDGQELLMPSLSSKQIWEQTNRWDGFDVLFKVPAANDKEYALNPTHEELITPIASKHAPSYKDLPIYLYQIQTKFRNEARPKSGLLRGREFRMKDLYSFHTTQEDLDQFYVEATDAYKRIFDRIGLGDRTHYTYADGGAFTDEYSHEFQTLSEWGEDTVYLCKCGTGHNKEIFKEGMDCLECGKNEFEEVTAAETANIFKLGTRFSEAFKYTFAGEDGKPHPVIMGCYGIGTSRIMGVIAETLSDDSGLAWPVEVAPFVANIISIGDSVQEQAEKLYANLRAAGVEVLWDDRDGSPGGKFKDNDLMGIPYRIVISEKTDGKFEFKERKSDDVEMLTADELMKRLG